MTASTLRNTPAVRFFKTPLALGFGRGGDHRTSLLIGFTVSGRIVEIVSARITSFVDPHGVAATTALWDYVRGPLLETVPTTAEGCRSLARYTATFMAEQGVDEDAPAFFNLIARSPLHA